MTKIARANVDRTVRSTPTVNKSANRDHSSVTKAPSRRARPDARSSSPAAAAGGGDRAGDQAAALAVNAQIELEGRVPRAVQKLADRAAERRRQLRLAEDGAGARPRPRLLTD